MNLPTARWAGLLLLVGLIALACGPSAAAPTPPTTPKPAANPDCDDQPDYACPGGAPTATPRPLPTTTVSGIKTEVVAEGLLFPQSLSFAPDGRLFFVEVKKDQARVLNGRVLQEQPVLQVQTTRGTEHGLVGLALDPDFAHNHYLYTYYPDSQRGNEAGVPRRHRLTRWIEQDGVASGERAVHNDLPVGKCCHTGGKMAFAADGTMFLTVGDQGDADRRRAQDPKELNGKILRLDPKRAPLTREPPAALIWASGLRNPYGIDVHPVTGAPFVTDNGPDGCDELNLGRQGANYGNPVAECSPHDPRFDDPLWDSGADRLGLTGLRIYRGAMFPELVNHPLFCAVNTGHLMRAVMTPDFNRVERVEQVLSGADGEGCRLDLAVAPDGSIYYSSVTKVYRLYR